MCNLPAAAVNSVDVDATEEGIAALHKQAKTHHLAGDLAAARNLYEAVLAERSAHADARFRLGILDLQCGDAGRTLRAPGRARIPADVADVDRPANLICSLHCGNCSADDRRDGIC